VYELSGRHLRTQSRRDHLHQLHGRVVLGHTQLERVCQVRGGDILGRCLREKRERVRAMPGGDVVVGRGKCVSLSCEYIRTTRTKLCRVSGQSVRTGTEHRQGGVCL
jgi:hypothetical protein